MPPTIDIDSDRYSVLEAYKPMDMIESELDTIKDFIGYMKHHYDLDVVFLTLNIGNVETNQVRFLKERIPEIILIDYSDKGYFTNSRYSTYCRTSRNVITSSYPALVLSIANKVQILSVVKDEVGDKRYYYNKNDGLIQQIFDGLDSNETLLMKINFTDAFGMVKKLFTALVAKHHDLYLSHFFQENIIVLIKLRIDYINPKLTINPW